MMKKFQVFTLIISLCTALNDVMNKNSPHLSQALDPLILEKTGFHLIYPPGHLFLKKCFYN